MGSWGQGEAHRACWPAVTAFLSLPVLRPTAWDPVAFWEGGGELLQVIVFFLNKSKFIPGKGGMA